MPGWVGMMPLIGLCPQTSEEGRPEANLRRIADCAREGKAQGLDLVLLGEAFLQGFDCLSLQMEAGLKVALWADDAMIQGIHETARQPGSPAAWRGHRLWLLQKGIGGRAACAVRRLPGCRRGRLFAVP